MPEFAREDIAIGEPVKADTFSLGILRGVLMGKQVGKLIACPYYVEFYPPQGYSFDGVIGLWCGGVEKCDEDCEQCRDKFRCWTNRT